MFPEILVPQNGWFIMEHPSKMDDLGVPLFLETPNYSQNIKELGGFLSRILATGSDSQLVFPLEVVVFGSWLAQRHLVEKTSKRAKRRFDGNGNGIQETAE